MYINVLYCLYFLYFLYGAVRACTICMYQSGCTRRMYKARMYPHVPVHPPCTSFADVRVRKACTVSCTSGAAVQGDHQDVRMIHVRALYAGRRCTPGCTGRMYLGCTPRWSRCTYERSILYRIVYHGVLEHHVLVYQSRHQSLILHFHLSSGQHFIIG